MSDQKQTSIATKKLWIVVRDCGYDGINNDTFTLFDTQEEAVSWINKVKHLVDYGTLVSYEADASFLKEVSKHDKN